MKINNKSYFGGKGSDGTYQTIINNIPECDVFAETHAGFARITEKMNHKGITILNDVSCKVIEALKLRFPTRIIENHVSARLYQDILCCSSTKNLEQFYLLFDPLLSKKERHKLLFENYGGDIILENLPAKDFIDKYRKLFEFANTVIYSDPPYPLGSRKNEKCRYEFEMTDEQHYELIDDLDFINCDKLISTYPNEIYEKKLSHFNKIEFYSQTRQGKALEYLYMNFLNPVFLNDYPYVGKDYREREAFKKQKANFLRKYDAMNPQLKNAIRDQLLSF